MNHFKLLPWVLSAVCFGGCASGPDEIATSTAGSNLAPATFSFPSRTDQYDSPPAFMRGDAPSYPWPLLAHSPQITGHAILSFTIDEKGRAVHPHTLQTTHPYFATAVAAAMSSWRFRPALLDGKPVAVVVPDLRFEFGPTTGGKQTRY